MHNISTRLYYLLLRLYPANFRHKYGDLMAQAFRDCLRDAQREGVINAGVYWLNALFDLLVNALGERMAVAQAGSIKHRALRGASFIALFLSYPLLWYGILVMLVFYAEPTGYASPAGTVSYYVARLARIQVLAHGVPTVIVGISLLIAGRVITRSPRLAPRWSLAFINTLATPVTVLLFFPVKDLVHGLGLVDWETYANSLYYPPTAFLIWIPVMLAQITFLLWLHHRIALWSLRFSGEDAVGESN